MQSDQAPSTGKASGLDFAAGGGDMGAALRDFDWAATALGPLASWPQSLRTAASMMLNARHPMYVAWGPDLLLLYNDGYRQILGARAADPYQVLGKPFREVWTEVWDQVGPMLDVTLRGESLWFEDHAFTLTRNGFPEQVYASFSTSPIRGESGAITGVLCVCSETTDKVRSQQERDAALAELATHVEKLQIATDSAELGMFDYQFQGGVLTCSERTLLHFGLPPGSDVPARLLIAALHPGDRDRVLDETRAALASPRQEHYRCEYRTAGPAGGQLRWIVTRGRMIRDAAGRPLRLIGTTLDVTERRQVEARLRLLDTIGEATRVATEPEAIMAHSTRLLGEYLGVTRVAYADLEPDNDRFTIRHDWCAGGAASTVGIYSLDLFGSRATSSMRMGRTLLINDVDRELAPGDGFEMFNQIGIKAIICCPLVRQGRLVAMMAVHQQQPRTWSADEVALVEAVVDRCWAHIERVRSTEALREADRRKSEFLATLAHELRNPLAPIRNALELLRLGAGKPALMDKLRATMERQVAHMVHLINDLLDIARISSGKVVLKIERVDLQSVIASAVETSMPLIEAAGHRLELDLPGQALWMEGDAVRLSQVLSNLLSNAAKYTPQRGSIGIGAAVEGGTAVIRVTDTGIGLAQEALESVFEMFAQAPHSIGISKGGLGIGLTLVRHLVLLHGGTVSASSPGPGLGSTFTIRLPLADAAQAAPPAATADGAPAQDSGRLLRVLVADDNVDAADTLASLLRAKGHVVRVAYDGAAAVQAGAAFRPDLAFLDIGMPHMDGCQAARALRALPGLDGLRLAALTGWGAREDRARTRDAGFDHHLLKPAAPEQVDAVLAAAMLPR
jgi:signal transduction histidine kinase/PAS domain-containing protein